MATIGEILAAKGKKPPVIDDTMELTPPTQAPQAPRAPASPMPGPDEINQAPAPIGTSSSAPRQAVPTPTDDGSGDLRDLQAAQDEADRRANLKQSMREVVALFSQGAQDPNKLDLSDVQAMRQRPMQMYQARQAAKKQAAESALQAAHARYFGAEAENIPKKLAQEQGRIDSEIAQKKAELAEHIRNNDQVSADKAMAEVAALERTRIQEAGAQSRYSPYKPYENKLTGETGFVNEHTGEVLGGGGEPPDPEVIKGYQERHLLPPKEQADLNASRKSEADLESIDPKKAAGNWLDRLLPQTGVARTVGDYLNNNVIRSPEEAAEHQKALEAGAQATRAIAGARGFSKTEQPTLKQITISAGDTEADIKRKVAALKAEHERDIARSENKLPISHQKKGATAVPDMQDPRTGKTMTWDGSKWTPK